ncbi:hypothetical protein Tco_1476991 [Tanacetum coccineum]
MAKQGQALVHDNPSGVKFMKYTNFIRDHEWVKPHSPRIFADVERVNQPLPRGVTAFYLEYAQNCNIRFPMHSFVFEILRMYSLSFSQMHPFGYQRVNAFILVCVALSVPPSLCVFRSMFVLRKHGSWCSVEKHSRYKNTFSIVIAKGLSGWHTNWVLVDTYEDILSFQFVRWSNNVNLDSEDLLPIPPGLEFDSYNRLHDMTILGGQFMDILSLLVASDDEGVLERSEPTIPHASPNAVEGHVPHPFILEILGQVVLSSWPI